MNRMVKTRRNPTSAGRVSKAAKKAKSSRTSKDKEITLDGSAKEIIAEAPGWAKAMIEMMEDRFNNMGAFVEGIDGRIVKLTVKVNFIVGGPVAVM